MWMYVPENTSVPYFWLAVKSNVKNTLRGTSLSLEPGIHLTNTQLMFVLKW